MYLMRKHRRIASLLAWFSVSLLVGGTANIGLYAADGDWPQWRGPQRDGHAAPQSLLQEWPEGGPKLKWKYENAGAGYSASSVADGKLFTMGTRGEECFAICLSASDGMPLWETSISRASTDGDYTQNWGGGPRSSPTVDGDYVYVISDIGTVACLKISDGSMVWSKNFVSDFGGAVPTWGYSESVLIDGDRAIVTPGGKNFLVGLDKLTGEKVFGSQGFEAEAQYVSVMRIDLGGKGIYLTAGKIGLLGIDAKTGAKLFEDAATGNGTAVIPTPVVSGDIVYHTSAYGAGCAAWQMSVEGDDVKAKQLYHISNQSMQNHHGGVVLVDGVIYGFSNTSRGRWMAQDLMSGDILWSEALNRNRSGSITYADGRLYCYGDADGKVNLVDPNREKLTVVGELTLPKQTSMERRSGAIWAHPVVADQTLIIRDQDLIYAYDIAK